MSERRQHKRFKRRLTIRWGENDLARAGFTYDVSAGGLFVLSDALPVLGRRVHVQLFFDKESYLLFEMKAIREKLVPAELRQVVKGGFAAIFLNPEALLKERLPAAGAPEPEVGTPTAVPVVESAPGRTTSQRIAGDGDKVFTVEFASLDDLRASFARELRHGGVFVPSQVELARETQVTLLFRMPFARRQFATAARVVHSKEGGLGMLFGNPGKVLAELEAILRG